MAVRRISDLPNLYSYYENAQLSNGLMEVSYAEPVEPKRYVSYYANIGHVFDKYLAPYAKKDDLSLYVLKSTVSHISSSISSNSTWIPDGKSVYDYIEAQDFLKPEDLEKLGIGSLKDLVNSLDALLNTKPLVLLVAQWGVMYDDIFDSSGKMRYDIALTKKNYKTPIWKYTGDDAALADIRSKYYNAHDYDPIFFKTINDAVKFSQRFKFLEDAYIRIFICTDLILPLECQYHLYDNGSKVQFDKIGVIESELAHSDNCKIQVQGVKISSVLVNVAANEPDKIRSYEINFSLHLRRLFANYKSSVNYPFQSMFRVKSQYVEYSNILLDYGSNKGRDSGTYSSYIINHLNNTLDGDIHDCALMYADVGMIGCNLKIIDSGATFSNCDTALRAMAGSRSQINGYFECLSCGNTALAASEGTILVRDTGIYTFGYIQSAIRRIQTVDSGIFKFDINMLFDRAMTDRRFDAMRPTAFIKLKSSTAGGVTTYSIDNYVSYDNMSTTYEAWINDSTLSSKLSAFVPNNYNITVGADANDDVISTRLDEPWASFTERFTALPIPLNGEMNAYSAGTYNAQGFARFRYDKLVQSITTTSRLFDNYDKDRLNSNSKLRQWIGLVHKGLTLTSIWDNPKYNTTYDNPDHGVSYDLNDDDFTIYFETNRSNDHQAFDQHLTITSSDNGAGKVAYSFEKIAGVDSNRDSPLNPAIKADFASLSADMSSKLGYQFVLKS